MSVYFTETSSFTKVGDKLCENHYHEEYTLVKATEKCKADENCKMFYSSSCTDEGPFRLCHNQSDSLAQNTSTCAYSKKETEGLMNIDS